jgi:CheY-like chemotaxis protein
MRRVIFIDDDLCLVEQVRQLLREKGIELIGPPDLSIEAADIKRRLDDADVLILDLNINGSAEGGVQVLRALKRPLKARLTPVIVCSKYLMDTCVFRGEGCHVYHEGRFVRSAPPADGGRVDSIRKIYPVYAFVSKLERDAMGLLADIVARLCVKEVSRDERNPD